MHCTVYFIGWVPNLQVGERRVGEQRRGAELRSHIQDAAKDIFLEQGYERTSMDAIAAHAGASKRSLYAHFASKDNLLLAVLASVRERHLEKLKTPEAYASEPVEAVTLFCGRLLELIIWEAHIRTCRLTITEAERLPASARAYYEAVFASANERVLRAYLTSPAVEVTPTAARALADLIFSERTVLPHILSDVVLAVGTDADDRSLATNGRGNTSTLPRSGAPSRRPCHDFVTRGCGALAQPVIPRTLVDDSGDIARCALTSRLRISGPRSGDWALESADEMMLRLSD